MGTLIPLRTLAITFALMLAVACGSDAVPAPTATTPTAAPFVVATTETFSGISAASVDLLGLGAKHEFPVALLSSSEQLTSNEVSRLWTEFLSDARIVGGKGLSMWDLCVRESPNADGASENETWRVGQIIKGGTSGGIVGEGVEARWKVEHSPAQRWNVTTLAIEAFAGDGTGIQVELVPPSDATGLPEIFEKSGGTSGGDAVHEIAAEVDSICHG